MKIISVKSLGFAKTYSPEMLSSTHNYITASSNAIHANSHGVSYCMVAFRCLYLKAHFAPEWWASVMSDCKKDKMVRYMGVARSESWSPTEVTYAKKKPEKKTKGIVFDTIDINNLNRNFSVVGNVVTQGLIGIDGFGDSVCNEYSGHHNFTSIMDLIEKKKANKTVIERFIKLGAFKNLPGHQNARALWMWYQYHYCNGKEYTALRKEINELLLADQGWTEDKIRAEIEYQTQQYKAAYPKRNKIPPAILKFKPEIDTSIEAFGKFYASDFDLAEKLEFQKEYLGFYVDSPMDLYDSEGGATLKDAKDRMSKGMQKVAEVSVLITGLALAQTKTKKDYAKLTVTDGKASAIILMWENELKLNIDNIGENIPVKIAVQYDHTRGIYTVVPRTIIKKLKDANRQ